MLTAAAGGARSLLAARGELAPGLVLKASVAASVRSSSDRPAGNRVGTMVVPLPLSDPAAAHRLEQIARATTERKKQPPYQLNGRMLQRWMAHTMSHQRLVNLLVSDLAGPAGGLRFAGVPVHELFQFGVVQGNITVSVGALSYAGQLAIGIVGDSDAAPDLAVFSAGMSAALDELGVLSDQVTFGVPEVARGAVGWPY
ncbi:MAG: WS/DGAT domain-containing protein [Actinomycetota bacterium]